MALLWREDRLAVVDCPGMTFGVHRGDWGNLGPEVVRLVAPPISVSTVRVGAGAEAEALEVLRRAQRARSRANMPVERHRRPNR